MARQRIVVLGASGFIGKRTIAALAATDWAHPVAVSRRIGSAHFGGEIETVALDAADAGALEKVIASASGVVSCIAGNAHDIVHSGTALFEVAARASSPPRVVYLSSVAAYGAVHGTVDENTLLLGDIDAYSASKAAVDRLAAPHPFVVRLRPGIVYGPESEWWTDRIARLLVSRRIGDLGPLGNGVCNLVHVDDVVTAIMQSLTSPAAAGEAFNLGSAEPPTWNEYFARYAQALRAAPARKITRTRLRLEISLYGPLLKIAEEALGPRAVSSRPAIRPWLIDLCQRDIRMNVQKAQDSLGMRWRPLDQGLEESAAWFLAGGRSR